jgi:hypothetical protein
MSTKPNEPLTTYSFEYLMGQSKPGKTIGAHDDEEAKKLISKYLAEKNGMLVGPIKATRTETWELHLDSPTAKAA